MGVMIFLDIMPNHIEDAEWEKVYEETLELIHAYPFLDSVFDDATYDCNWKYTVRTKERAIRFADNQLGWHAFGDEESLRIAESFSLVRNLEYYRKETRQNGNCDDILFSRIYTYPGINEQLKSFTVDKVSVFDSKTQGEPFHIPMLAIACLIESRFPKHAIVSGDISIVQMKHAIDWANSILKQPISLTERTDNEKLLQRVKTGVKDDVAALEAFMSLQMQEHSFELGTLIRSEFSPEEITAYYIAHFRDYQVGTIGFSTQLSNYFSLGFHIADACKICVLIPNGCNYDAEKFAKAVLSLGWEKNTENMNDLLSPRINSPDSAQPETVNSMFGKMMIQMTGFRESVKSNLSYEEVTATLRKYLGDLCDIDSLLDQKTNKKEIDTDLNDALFEKLYKEMEDAREAHQVEMEQYTITDIDELIVWKIGHTIHPALESSLAKVKEFIEQMVKNNKVFFAEFQEKSAGDKMRTIIQYNEDFYIHKKVWDDLSNNIHDPLFTNKMIGLMRIDASGLNFNKLCKALANNRDLFNAYLG